jgi:hypothetical protein
MKTGFITHPYVKLRGDLADGNDQFFVGSGLTQLALRVGGQAELDPALLNKFDQAIIRPG